MSRRSASSSTIRTGQCAASGMSVKSCKLYDTQTNISVAKPGDYRARAPLAILSTAIIFVVLFWRLGEPTFWDPDEAHYAETTREMIASSDWAAPFYNERPFFDKTVLFH